MLNIFRTFIVEIQSIGVDYVKAKIYYKSLCK